MKSRLTVAAAVLMLTAGVTALGVKTGHAEDFDYRQDFDERVLKGLKISPVPLNLRHLDPTLVGLGSYIVNAQGACNDCHTAPSFAEGHDPFLGQKEQVNTKGYLAGGAAFGPFISRNLTPRANGMPANLTWDQFDRSAERHRFQEQTSGNFPAPASDALAGVRKDVHAGASGDLPFLRAIPSLPTPPPPTS